MTLLTNWFWLWDLLCLIIVLISLTKLYLLVLLVVFMTSFIFTLSLTQIKIKNSLMNFDYCEQAKVWILLYLTNCLEIIWKGLSFKAWVSQKYYFKEIDPYVINSKDEVRQKAPDLLLFINLHITKGSREINIPNLNFLLPITHACINLVTMATISKIFAFIFVFMPSINKSLMWFALQGSSHIQKSDENENIHQPSIHFTISESTEPTRKEMYQNCNALSSLLFNQLKC